MKRLLLLSPILILTLAACAPTKPQQQSTIPAPAAAMERTVPQGRVIPVTAELWKFTPNVIEAKKGEVVTLQITGVSGTHGFSVPDLGINETIFMGKTVNIPLPTDRAGTFSFACSIQCGSGHSEMKGQIVITE